MTTLQKTFPYIDWRDYITWNLKNTTVVCENETIYVTDPDYLHKLENLLEKTQKRTLANHFGARLTLYSSDLINNILNERQQQYQNEGVGVSKPDPRITDCIMKTEELYAKKRGTWWNLIFLHNKTFLCRSQLVLTV